MTQRHSLPKSADDVVAEVKKKLLSTSGSYGIWSRDAGPESYPLNVFLNTTSGGVKALGADALSWRKSIELMALVDGVEIENKTKSPIRGIATSEFPVRVVIDTQRAALNLAGPKVQAQASLRDARRIEYSLAALPPELEKETLYMTRAYSSADFSLLLACASWARDNVVDGLTPRQVPVPGVQGKFLDAEKNRSMVAKLAGKGTLGLVPAPQYVDVKYLDPESDRSYGLCRPGYRDEARPSYDPSIAIIVENKETFSDFPDVPGGVCLFGSGNAAVARLAGISWLGRVPRVVYWGDMDTDGLEILAKLRQSGVDCESVLMDSASFREFESIGSSTSKDGKQIPLPRRAPSELCYLTSSEAKLYEEICAGIVRYRRIEQEKIPFRECLRRLGY